MNQHWCFFSYARANKSNKLVNFYSDLWDVLKQKLTATEQQQHRPFSDWEKLQLASRWAVSLEEALAWSGVLVCITSRAYVTQEWCGRELGFFEQLSKYHYRVCVGADSPRDLEQGRSSIGDQNLPIYARVAPRRVHGAGSIPPYVP